LVGWYNISGTTGLSGSLRFVTNVEQERHRHNDVSVFEMETDSVPVDLKAFLFETIAKVVAAKFEIDPSQK
jgi:uncharacterized LabA/DUF88 family protein